MQGCTWTETGTEENLFVLETLAKAEGCLQAVVEWEEDGDLEPVRADDHREGGREVSGRPSHSVFCAHRAPPSWRRPRSCR